MDEIYYQYKCYYVCPACHGHWYDLFATIGRDACPQCDHADVLPYRSENFVELEG